MNIRWSRKKKTQKYYDQRNHAKRRAVQRYDLEITTKDIDNMVAAIQSGNNHVATMIERQTNTRSVWKIVFKDRELFVVYDRHRKSIATFLTQDMIMEEKDV